MSQVQGIGSGNGNIDYGKIASGKRIQSAADDAAGLAISEKLSTAAGGTNQGNENTQDGISLTKVTDGALSGITEHLQRIRELSISALNGTKSADDKQAIQKEVDQLLQNIEQTAQGTQFNTLKPLDGSMADINIASNADGSGMSIKMVNSTLENLGIEGYDVTGDFDISRIDEAIAKVSEGRSTTGATANALEAQYNYGRNYEEQLVGADSRIEDLDIPQAISDLRKNEVLEDYRLMMQKKEEEQEAMVTKLLQ